MKTSLTTIFLLISILCFTQLENYYENGQVKTSLVRENDLVKTTSYYQNGNIRDVGYFDLDDRRQVKWKEYYENGNLFCEGSFLNGKQNGKWYELYENGQLKGKGNYVFSILKRGRIREVRLNRESEWKIHSVKIVFC